MSAPADSCRCCGRALGPGVGLESRGLCVDCSETRPQVRPPHSRGIHGGEEPAGGFAGEWVAAPGVPPGAAALPGPGSVLGGLVIEGSLGRGGMGQVLVARDPGLDRRVAVKFLRADLLGNGRAEMFFRREGRSLAGISHPNVVRVFSVGEWEGWPYLVMELVEGRTVHARMREGPLSLPETLRTAEELASALAAVHAAGIVHRDVNPANVVLRKESGAACLIDFGLAKGIRRASESSGVLAGTPHYMAPEQVARQEHDQRVDVYAFGATLFEMVSGRVPHHESDNTAAFFRSVLHDDAPLLRSVSAEAPRALEVLTARALARAPELRHADGAVLLAEVRAVRRDLEGEGTAVTAGRDATGDQGPPSDPPRDPSESIPLLGRNAEYAAALQVLDRLDLYRGQVLLVEGEAGAGKTRLLKELEKAARARAFGVIRCSGGEFSGSPYRAIRAALLDYARVLGASGPEDVVTLVARASPNNGPLAPAIRWFLDPAGHREETQPGRSDLRLAFLALVRALLSARPALLVAEDVHDLDAGSLELLLAAADEGRRWPLGLAFSYRPGDAADARAPLAGILPRLRGVQGAIPLTLGPLDEGAVASMIHLGLRVDEGEACRLAPLLHRKSSGNPLYLIEALKLLEQEREADKGKGPRRVRQRLTSMTIPPRLLEIAVRRVGGLPPPERDALGVASVDPDGVTADLVARCLDASRISALRILQQLVSTRGILRQQGERYWIPHGEIRDAVHGDLIPELRAAYHAEAADALLEAGAAEKEPARVGRHLKNAGRPREAAPHLLEAGRRLLLGHSPVEALEFFEESLECGGAGEGTAPAMVGRAQALELLGELESARAILESMVAEGGEKATEALLPLAEFERNRGRHREVLELLAGADLERLPLDRRIRVRVLEAQALSQVGTAEEAMESLEKAEAISDDSPTLRLLELLSTQGTVRWRLGRPEEATTYFERALELAERLGAIDRSAAMLYNLALASSDVGESGAALDWISKAAERALLAGNPRTLAYARLLEAEILTEALRLPESGRVLDEVAEVLDDLDSDDARILYAGCRAELKYLEQDFRGALHWTDRVLALAGDAPRKRMEIRTLRARCLLAMADPSSALQETRAVPEADLDQVSPAVAEELLSQASRALRELHQEGPERAKFRASEPIHSCVAAAERAVESASEEERLRWTEVARHLARNQRLKSYLAGVLRETTLGPSRTEGPDDGG